MSEMTRRGKRLEAQALLNQALRLAAQADELLAEAGPLYVGVVLDGTMRDTVTVYTYEDGIGDLDLGDRVLCPVPYHSGGLEGTVVRVDVPRYTGGTTKVIEERC